LFFFFFAVTFSSLKAQEVFKKKKRQPRTVTVRPIRAQGHEILRIEQSMFQHLNFSGLFFRKREERKDLSGIELEYGAES
jgi:hypothetical protein